MILLALIGKPVPFKSPRVYGTATFNPNHLVKKTIQEDIRKNYDGDILDCPVRVDYIFTFPIPQSFSKRKVEEILHGTKWYPKRPDTSNLVKFYDDCLIDTILKDDSLIVNCTIKKQYSTKHLTIIKIEAL